MKQKLLTNRAFSLGVSLLLVAVLGLSTFLAAGANTAHAQRDNDQDRDRDHSHWWWNDDDQDDNDNDPVQVTIMKYIDGELATTDTAGDTSFSMSASWEDETGIGDGSGDYSLGADNSYQAVTSEMDAGASYSTSETLDGETVASTCSEGVEYELVGYTTGSTVAEAEAGTPSETVPELEDLSSDQYIIVWNDTCDGDDDPSQDDPGEISGEVTGGSDGDPVELEVTSIDAVDTTAVANGNFEDGWEYVFNITVPEDEADLAMKFSDWLHSNGTNTIPVADNMRISSDQADNGGATVTLSAADTYSTPELYMTGDLDGSEDGLQVQVVVEVAVPAGTLNGTYSTSYGVQTLPH